MKTTNMISTAFIAVVALSGIQITEAAVWAQSSQEVVLWNRLGNDQEVQTSVIGPGGTRTGGAFTPGKFGGAYLATYTEDGQLTFPANVIPAAHGTIDFWAQLINMPSNISTGGVELLSWQHGIPNPTVQWRLGFAANNGCGGSGLYGTVGVAFTGSCVRLVDASTGGSRYNDVLPLGSEGAWHHYAITWDEGGLTIAGGQRVAVFLDGTMVATRWQDRANPTFDDPADYPSQIFEVLRINENQGMVAIDNLIIRNVVKTDFSDRETECPDSICVVTIDIKPGSFPNSINPRSNGVIPVAILTTDSFNATTINPTTVLFGTTGTEAAPAVHFAFEDVDGDGDTDMILHFKTQETGIQCEDTSASLTGETFGGLAIEGSDSIQTVGCKHK